MHVKEIGIKDGFSGRRGGAVMPAPETAVVSPAPVEAPKPAASDEKPSKK